MIIKSVDTRRVLKSKIVKKCRWRPTLRHGPYSARQTPAGLGRERRERKEGRREKDRKEEGKSMGWRGPSFSASVRRSASELRGYVVQ